MEATEANDAMKPWEQHHAVISMPRFAYSPASVLKQNAGFLVTCTFRREKSATKEILALIQEYMNLAEDGSQGHDGTVGNETGNIDERPVEVDEARPETGLICNSQEVKSVPGNVMENSTENQPGNKPCVGKEDTERYYPGENLAVTAPSPSNRSHEDILNVDGNEFSLVKLATMGVIYICTSRKPPVSVINIVSRIVKDVQTGVRAAPKWCHRIVPVQATCSMKREELRGVVSHLVKGHVRGHGPSFEHPINYAVAFNRRGTDVANSCATDSSETTVLSRDECIKIVTSAVELVTTAVQVDLTSPQMVVNVELIPVAGAQSCLMCAVSVLPGDLIVSKPKIHVKPLVAFNPISKKRKQSK
ncbi:unnamed protein product [Calypogeia fissa]